MKTTAELISLYENLKAELIKERAIFGQDKEYIEQMSKLKAWLLGINRRKKIQELTIMANFCTDEIDKTNKHLLNLKRANPQPTPTDATQ